MWLFFLINIMEQFDSLFFSVFHFYRTKYKTKANNIALFYILLLQASILLLLGTFFMLFFNGMNVDVISSSKAWVIYVLIVIALIFRNWIYFTGKKRKVLNTQLNKTGSDKAPNIWLLWLIPIVCTLLSVLLMERF
jgi:hypothetical protein